MILNGNFVIWYGWASVRSLSKWVGFLLVRHRKYQIIKFPFESKFMKLSYRQWNYVVILSHRKSLRSSVEGNSFDIIFTLFSRVKNLLRMWNNSRSPRNQMEICIFLIFSMYTGITKSLFESKQKMDPFILIYGYS